MDPLKLALTLSLSTIITAFIVLIIQRAMKAFYGPQTEEAQKMYIGGEEPGILRLKIPRAEAMFWGLVRRYAEKLFSLLRDVVHSGRLSDWVGYMSFWLFLLLFLSFIAILMFLRV